MRTIWVSSQNLLQLERIRERVGAGGPPVRLLGEAQSSDLVLVDLTAPDALGVIGRVHAAGAEVLAFGPHTQVDLLATAKSAGAKWVVANSGLPGALTRALDGWQEAKEGSGNPSGIREE